MTDWIKILIAGLVGGYAAVLSSTFTYFNTDRELDIRMVGVALTILSAQTEGTKSQYARVYALDLLEQYGRVKIANKEEWAKDGELPTGDFRWWTTGNTQSKDTTLEEEIGKMLDDSLRMTKEGIERKMRDGGFVPLEPNAVEPPK